MTSLDLVVAGGGPAGLVTALHARRAGMTVTVVEPRKGPVDKPCGEGLMPPAVRALRGLGVDAPGRPFRGIRYLDRQHAVDADFASGSGLGALRTALHRSLRDAAERVGVDFVPGRVDTLAQDATGVSAAGLRARYLVGADGLHSHVRRLAGLAALPARHRRYGVRAHFTVPPWSDRVEVHWAEGGEAYVTPVGDDCVGVAVLGPAGGSYAERLAAFPELLARLPSDPVDRPRGAGPLRQHATGRVAGRVLLVGDAAGYLDALTGEGMAISFACAEALVRRVLTDDPDRYEADYRRLTRRYRVLTSALLVASRPPVLRRRIVPLAARAPWLFRAVVTQLAT